MSILDKIKGIFSRFQKKEQPLLLPTNKVNINSGEEFRKGYAAQVVESPKEPTLEECIEEFIAQYAIQEEINPNSYNISYNAFKRMFCSEEEEIGENDKNQTKLMELIRKRGDHTTPQISKDRVAFMHISGEIGIDENKDRDVEKIYLNCDRKNIALLTGAIYREICDITGDKLQMKFVSEQCYDFLEGANEEDKIVKNYQRNDRIVIYAENHAKAEQISEKINELRRSNPQLFSTTKTLPLLPKKFGFIGIGKEKRGVAVKTPLGITAGATYNDLLAEVMFNSVVSGFDIEMSGMVLSQDTGEKTPQSERMRQYAEVFDKMSPEQKNRIISNSRDVFLQVCRENNVHTVYTPEVGRDNQMEQSQ